MDQKISLLREVLIRLGLPSPKIFQKLKIILYIIGGLFVGVTVFNTSLPNTKVTEILKFVGVIGTSMTAMGIFISNIAVENKEQLDNKIQTILTTQTTQMTKQVFWDLSDIGTIIIAIDGETINDIAANDIPNIDSRFSVGLDDKDQEILIVTSSATVSITTSSNFIIPSVIADFTGGRPTRPK